MLKSTLLLAAIVALSATQTPQAYAQGHDEQHSAPRAVEHAVAGTLERLDLTARTIVVTTADGAEETFRITEHTTVRALESAGRGVADLGGAVERGGIDALANVERGSDVIVHYAGEGAERTATTVAHGGRDALHAVSGTVSRVDHGTRTIAIETGDGAVEVFELGEHGVIDAGTGLVDASEWTGTELEHGAHVAVHYTEDAGRKIAHLVKA